LEHPYRQPKQSKQNIFLIIIAMVYFLKIDYAITMQKSHFKNPRKSVNVAIFSPDRSEVLLIKRRDIPVWVLPGGGIDPGESPENAALREGYEETGFQVAIQRKVAEYLPVNRLTKYTYLFECAITSGNAAIGSETSDVRFFPVSALPKLIPPPYQGWIADAHANLPHLLQKKIAGVSYFILIKLLLLHPILVSRFLLTKLGIHLNS
jgi:8-oxo-dGTP diphosphatase